VTVSRPPPGRCVTADLDGGTGHDVTMTDWVPPDTAAPGTPAPGPVVFRPAVAAPASRLATVDTRPLAAARRGLRPMTTPQLLDAAAGVLRRRARVVVPVVLALVLPVQVLGALLQRSLAPGADGSFGPLQGVLLPFVAETPGQFLLAAVVLVVQSFLLVLIGAAMAHVVVADCLGTDVTAGRVLWATVRRSPAYLAAWLLRAGVIVASSCTYVGPVVFVTFWVLLAPVMAIEGAGPVRGLKRAWTLTAGRFWPSLGFVALSALVSTVIGTALSALPLVVVLMGPFDAALWVVSGVVGVLTALVVLPIVAGGTTMLYLDTRVRREGIDLQLDLARAFPVPTDAAR
jgi:hypothetical protein